MIKPSDAATYGLSRRLSILEDKANKIMQYDQRLSGVAMGGSHLRQDPRWPYRCQSDAQSTLVVLRLWRALDWICSLSEYAKAASTL